MSRANVVVVSMAIYLAKRIAECNQPELRYSKSAAPDSTQRRATTDLVTPVSAWYSKAYKVIRFIISLMGIREACIVSGIAISLIGRSIFRLKLRSLSTTVENGVISGKEDMFWSAIKTFSMYIIPTSAFFATFNYLLSELAIHIRTNVSSRLLTKFTSDRVYFQVINASQLHSINPHQKSLQSYSNPDQVLTNDIEHFSYAVSGLFSHVMRPVVEILVNAERLYATGGAVIPGVMAIYLVVTSNVLNYIRSPVAGFTDLEQSLEGEYRSLIARIATSAEEIAALEGGKNEERNVLSSLHPLMEYSRSFAQFRCNMTFIDSVVARYWLMILGWRIVGVHFFQRQRAAGIAPEDLFRDYQNMSKTMLALSNGVGELIMSGRDVVKVFAYAEKLAGFEAVMDEFIQRNESETSSSPSTSSGALSASPTHLNSEYESALELIPQVNYGATRTASRTASQHCLVMEDVSIVPPNGSPPLHTGLNIIFRRNMHTIITGENGSGKSSLLRVLAGVWPVGRGRIVGPTINSDAQSAAGTGAAGLRLRPVLYLPQKPYMSLGSLRQQIVYPEILPDPADFAELDEQLLRILKTVRFSHLMHPSCYASDPVQAEPVRDTEPAELLVEVQDLAGGEGRPLAGGGGLLLSMVRDWSEVLSGGEKQRLSLARLFYHRPLFALLDESTSAVSQDVEEQLIRACVRDLDTTLITITHRPHLKKYHQFELHLTKGNEHTFTKISGDHQ